VVDTVTILGTNVESERNGMHSSPRCWPRSDGSNDYHGRCAEPIHLLRCHSKFEAFPATSTRHGCPSSLKLQPDLNNTARAMVSIRASDAAQDDALSAKDKLTKLPHSCDGPEMRENVGWLDEPGRRVSDHGALAPISACANSLVQLRFRDNNAGHTRRARRLCIARSCWKPLVTAATSLVTGEGPQPLDA
jgi:hypothetical protein